METKSHRSNLEQPQIDVRLECQAFLIYATRLYLAQQPLHRQGNGLLALSECTNHLDHLYLSGMDQIIHIPMMILCDCGGLRVLAEYVIAHSVFLQLSYQVITLIDHKDYTFVQVAYFFLRFNLVYLKHNSVLSDILLILFSI